MSAKRMYFSSAKAVRELGYRPRPPEEAISAALGWFQEHHYL
jgi:dihydroflavonol-4-reductase